MRPFVRGDVDAVFAYRSRPDVARYIMDDPMAREACAEAVQLRVGQTRWTAGGDKISLAVELRGEGAMIGELAIILKDEDDRQAEIGYIFHPDHHGRGYATEAARALLALGFGECGIHRILARCDVRNEASRRVMERLGMRQEAHFREHMLVKGRWTEEFYYAIIEDEWREAQALQASRIP